MTKVRPLRSRDELEKQLQAQIALGAINSLEEAEKAGNEDALEYSAQMMFDNVRIRISIRAGLTLPLIYHLSKDRNATVRCNIVKQYFSKYTDEMKENFYKEVINMYRTLNDNWPRSGTNEYVIHDAIGHIMKEMLHAKKDGTIAQLLERFGHVKGKIPTWMRGSELELRDMPKTVTIVYSAERDKNYNKHYHPLALMHPDIEIRKGALMRALKMKIEDLRYTFTAFSQYSIKEELYKFIATDPSPIIRRFLVNNMNHVGTLQYIADTDTDKLIKCKAKVKLLKVKKRAAYSKKYRENKDPLY